MGIDAGLFCTFAAVLKPTQIMKCYEGTILSVDSNDGVYRYLVEDNGRIIYVGNELPEAYKTLNIKTLGNRVLAPAFIDTHQHFASLSTFNAGLNVMEAESNEEIARMIGEYAAKADAKTIIAFGASPHSVKEGRLIMRHEIDAVCQGKEVMVVKYDGHACIVSTPLLNKLDKKLSKLRGYHPDTGEMNQEAFFACSDYISGSLSIPDLFRNMQNCTDYLASKGIGSIHTVSGVGFIANLDITIEKLFAKSLRNGFQIRVFPQALNTKVATSRRIPRIGGCFECALDGCFGSRDAALNKPYADAEGGDGILYYSDEKVIEFCKKANRLGLQIELHAIGDKAFDQATRALKAALDDYPREDHRHGIIHDCLPTEEGIAICKEYKIQMPVQSAFIGWKQEPDSYLEELLGTERASRLNPIKTFADNGIVVSFGSDAPCTDPDPIQWIHRAVNHSNLEERITVQQALRMATYNGAYTTFDEKERGSLEVDKIADMVILSDNPYTTPVENLKDIKVEELILSGRPYESAVSSLGRCILNGVFSQNKF